ncbi:GNAT family N-acetyltransferase [Blastopirellula sp. JC732]|uniref:GNAT family N-acetyltransferase n=1 Tax=Blastopirellula sediminis TaxID=2894196 RepID=A0A9X1MS02_9BACT|nr:GNAT family N-acetyltransferase [Blastopirellula sediminis]MCC9605405.1 GNAT family N-acetyltransferase [Blastopirellula sediminis]MCC9631295.1 GNAT family N-acetyltransferase [Blastopirellula sediminis]
MRVERLTTFTDLISRPTDWSSLVRGVPFRRPQWLASWWDSYAPGELYLLTVYDGDRLAGLLPLYRTRSAAKGNMLRLVGDGEVCTDYCSVLATPEDLPRVCAALAEWLTEAATSSGDSWDLLELENIAADDEGFALLRSELDQAGNLLHERDALQCWRLELPETLEAYEASQSKSHRKQIRRFYKRTLDTDRAQLHVCDNVSDLPKAMEVLIDLHMRRRRSLGQPGCFASPQFDRFLRTAAAELIAIGKCEILWLDLDEAPIAAEIHFLGQQIPYCYQAGVDPERLTEDPGSLMQAAIIRRSIEQRHTAIDFLRGDEPYKAHWRATPHRCIHLRATPNRAAAKVRHGLWLAGQEVKNWVKTGLNITTAE